METNDSGNNSLPDPRFLITAKGLKGKQSVRATFRLPEEIIKLLGAAAAQLGLQQKSLFDQLVEDKEVLDKVAEAAHHKLANGQERRQKTFVISRRSLDLLDHVARQQNIPRDVLVEISIQRLLPVMNDEQERHLHRKQIYQELEAVLRQVQSIADQSEMLLGLDDKAYATIKKVNDVCQANIRELKEIIEKGHSLEEFVTLKSTF